MDIFNHTDHIYAILTNTSILPAQAVNSCSLDFFYCLIIKFIRFFVNFHAKNLRFIRILTTIDFHRYPI